MSESKIVAWDYEFLSLISDEDTCITLSKREISALLTVTSSVMQWSTRWTGATNDQITSFCADLSFKLMSGKPSCKPIRPKRCDFPLPWRINGDQGLVLDICEDENMPITVNIYDCGCGCGENPVPGVPGEPGEPGGPGGPGAVTELPAGDQASRCDIVTSVVPFYISALRDYLVDVDTALNNGAALVDAILGTFTEIIDPTALLPNAIESLTELVELALDPLIAALDDPNLVLKTQANWWARTEDRDSGWSTITRNDLFTLARSLPNLWGNILVEGTVPTRLFGEILANIMSLDPFQTQVFIARDNADDTLCEYLASLVGKSFTGRVKPLPPPEIQIEDGGLLFRRVLVDLAVNGSSPFSDITGDDWLGLAFRAIGTDAGGAGVALGYTSTLTRDNNDTPISLSIGSSAFEPLGQTGGAYTGALYVKNIAGNSQDERISWIGSLTGGDNNAPVPGGYTISDNEFASGNGWGLSVIELWVISEV